jgi:hypothetical protein
MYLTQSIFFIFYFLFSCRSAVISNVVLLHALVEPADFSSVLFSKGIQYDISVVYIYTHILIQPHTRIFRACCFPREYSTASLLATCIHTYTHTHIRTRTCIKSQPVRHLCCLHIYTHIHIHIHIRTHTCIKSQPVRHPSACALLCGMCFLV